MQATSPQEPPVTMYHCAICSGFSPFGERHQCTLTRRQRARLEEWKRANAARAAHGPIPSAGKCETCGGPGTAHACPGPAGPPTPKVSPPAPDGEQIAASLQQAGYQITRRP